MFLSSPPWWMKCSCSSNSSSSGNVKITLLGGDMQSHERLSVWKWVPHITFRSLSLCDVHGRWHLPMDRGFRRCWTWLTCRVQVDIGFVPVAWHVIQSCLCCWPRPIITLRSRTHTAVPMKSPTSPCEVKGPLHCNCYRLNG